MKKLLSIALALVLILSMSIVASAEDAGATTKLTMTSAPATYTGGGVKKAYTVVGTDTDLYPAETLTFTSTAAKDNPEATNLTVNSLDVSSKNAQELTINVPAFSTVGLYHFTISENAPETVTQGVTYTKSTIGVSVLVEYDYEDTNKDGYGLKATFGITAAGENKDKADTFTNTYSVGSLNVKKEVAGNWASKTQKFDIDVTFLSTNPVLSDISVGNGTTIAFTTWEKVLEGENAGKWTTSATVQLAHGDDVTFSNIPDGVTYTVAEQSKHAADDANGSDPSKGYTVTYTGETGEIGANETKNAVVTNTKNTSVDTGITMDSMPYVLLLAVACFGMVVLFSKKRMMREN